MEPHGSFGDAQAESALLEQWVEAGWLSPRHDFDAQRFSEVDLARAYLIRDLKELGVNDDSMPIVLDLIDQVHGLRYLLREFLLTVKARHQEQDRA